MGISKIVIVDYDPLWPSLFEEEKKRLLSCVGEWAQGIEHIGSTAVPGLGAKPVIDILMGVRSIWDADHHCLEPIVRLGYEYIKEYKRDFPYRRYFRKSKEMNFLEHHLHLVEKEGDFWERHLAFRDYLRMNRETALEYEKLKRSLAPQFTDGNEYASAKTDFIKKIEKEALNRLGPRII